MTCPNCSRASYDDDLCSTECYSYWQERRSWVSQEDHYRALQQRTAEEQQAELDKKRRYEGDL